MTPKQIESSGTRTLAFLRSGDGGNMSRGRGLMLEEEGEHRRVGSGPLSCAELSMREYC